MTTKKPFDDIAVLPLSEADNIPGVGVLEKPPFVVDNALARQARGHRFEPCIAHWSTLPGTEIRYDELNAAYHARHQLSKSQVWDFAANGTDSFYARHIAKTISGHASSALAHGTLLHRWLEIGDKIWEELASPPASVLTETGLIGKKAQQWAADNCPEKQIVPAKEIAQLRAEAASVMSHSAARELIEAAICHEISVSWETASGDGLRCRPDLCTRDVWVDLKTTRETNILSSFWRSVADYGYHAQDAFYQWGMTACGMEAKPLVFVVVSTAPPHECHAVTLPAAYVAEGRRRMLRAIADIRLRTDLAYWKPDQHGEVIELSIPAHLMRTNP